MDAVVAGAGISGLACASELAEHGLDVLVLEAAERVGGAVESVRRNGFLLERGPNTVRGTPELEALAERAGVELARGKRGAPWVVSDGELVRVPPPLGALLRGRPIPLGAWLELAGEPFRARRSGPRSVFGFVAERLGATTADRLADLMTLGVYGAPAREVGFEAAFPDLAARLERHGSLTRVLLASLVARRPRGARPRGGLVSTARGLSALCQGLARQLGDRVRLGTPLRQVEGRRGRFEIRAGADGETRIAARHAVLALPPPEIARVLALPRAQRLLRSYRPSAQTLVSFALADPSCARRWNGFGFLVPSRERLPLLGCLFPSAIFPGRAPPGVMLLVVFAGPPLRDASDAALARTLAPLLRRLLGAGREPELLDVARHPGGIWLYDRRHPQRTRALRRHLEAAQAPAIAGAAFDGVAFSQAAASGLAAARALAAG